MKKMRRYNNMKELYIDNIKKHLEWLEQLKKDLEFLEKNNENYTKKQYFIIRNSLYTVYQMYEDNLFLSKKEDFDYKKFRRELKDEGHHVYKKGNYITIEPDQRCKFRTNWDIAAGYEEYLDFVSWDHFNDLVYEITFRIKED
jgi:hypothetical protein